MRRHPSRTIALVAVLATATLAPMMASAQEGDDPAATTTVPPGTTVPAPATTAPPPDADGDEPVDELDAHADHGHESTAPAERTGVSFTSSPASGASGTEVEVSGTECLLEGTDVPGEGVVVRYMNDGRALAYTTVPVRPDGSWSGSLVIPVDAPVDRGWLYARCVYPVHPDPVVYQARAFEVTGRGTAPEGTPRTPRFNGGIEAYAEYDGQSTCSPSTKPGMAAFMNLVRRNYGGGSLGVGRACGAGGTSEHKEGRAWDWAMNAGSAGDRGRVQSLFNWLFATDSQCRRFANARRVGMMYIIWNRRMFRMYDTDRGWAPYNGPSPHTDHVHFSLSRAGGRGSVSFWNPTFRAPGRFDGSPQRITNTTLGNAWANVRPISGDFDGDERHDLLWYDRDNGGGFVGYSTPNGAFAARTINVEAGRVPLVGDFNGDCRDDIIFYGPGGQRDTHWQGRPNRRFRGFTEKIPATVERPVVGDFNGDRTEDILWYNPGAGRDTIWFGTIYGFVRRNINVGGDYQPLGGDYDGDGVDDILWYGPGGATDRIWWGRRNGWIKRNIGFNLVADPMVGDFNGDDRADVYWYRPGKLADRMWSGRPNRTFQARALNMARDYQLPAAGDFDGDLQDDVFWHASTTWANRVWWY